MTTDLIERVRSRGAKLLPLGGRLRVLDPEKLEPTMIAELRQAKRAVLRALEVELAASVIVYEYLLREGWRSRARDQS